MIKFKPILATKECTEVIQTNFESKLPTIEDEELNTSTMLRKPKKFAKMKKCNGDIIHDSMLEQCDNADCNI